jgi:hypothetical protein
MDRRFKQDIEARGRTELEHGIDGNDEDGLYTRHIVDHKDLQASIRIYQKIGQITVFWGKTRGPCDQFHTFVIRTEDRLPVFRTACLLAGAFAIGGAAGITDAWNEITRHV